MLENDYIVKQIKEMTRALINMLFHVDTDSPTEDLLDTQSAKEQYRELCRLADQGELNEAGYELYDLLEAEEKEALKIALLYYSYINDKDSAFLEAHDYDRDEIKSDLKDLVERCGIIGISDVFLR